MEEKMVNKVRNSLLTLFMLIFLSSVASSQPAEGLNLKRLSDKLNLTDAQKEQIEKLRTDHQKAMVDLKANLEKAKIELREVMNKDDFTRNDYLAANNKLIKIRDEIQLANANHKMDILELMNKDQRKIITEDMKSEKRHRNFERKERGNRDRNRPGMLEK
jgi:Spy/CpxP family protein refolding chaperone